MANLITFTVTMVKVKGHESGGDRDKSSEGICNEKVTTVVALTGTYLYSPAFPLVYPCSHAHKLTQYFGSNSYD